MHSQTIERLRCDFGGSHSGVTAHERRTRWVVAITVVTMVAELVAGFWTGSLALLADGWHMASHAGALGLAVFAYWFARTRARTRPFTFGTGKVYALAGYTSAVVLALAALLMIVEAIERLFDPPTIRFAEALPVAFAGLAVNIASAWLLRPDHAQDHDHHHAHDHGHHHAHDHNLRAAYLHVVADALTSVLAIAALSVGQWLRWSVLDTLTGVLGGIIILHWSAGLCRGAARQLLDAVHVPDVEDVVRTALERIDDVRVADLHIWELGPGQRACVVSLVTSTPREVGEYRAAVLDALALAHLTVEVHRCPDHPAPEPSLNRCS